jgi:hypothetical protein
MSELVNARVNGATFRWQLLATVSAIALLGSAYGADQAQAADNDGDHPLLWIELGGQLSRLDEGQEAFAPVFPDSPPRPSIFSPSQKFERLPLYSIDEEGKISFEPDGSDWVLSASVRYGRSSSDKHVHQQTSPKPFYAHYSIHGVPYTNIDRPKAARFADTLAQTGENHSVLDFQAGKDVGLGMFGGKDGSSVFNLGIRFAQFSAKSNIALKSDPDFHRVYKYFTNTGFHITHLKIVSAAPYHSNAAGIQAARSFHGIGPSLSWNASAPFAGNAQAGEATLDWGLNAAVLFGRQKATIHHQVTAQYYRSFSVGHYIVSQHSTNLPARLRTVTVPNVGGFAGLSFRTKNFKVSAGYRADLFFGVMDGGIDAAKKENVGFYGPFASVSVGIGG